MHIQAPSGAERAENMPHSCCPMAQTRMTHLSPVPALTCLFSLCQVVVERYQKEKHLPLLDRTKFLVSQDLSLSQFLVTLR